VTRLPKPISSPLSNAPQTLFDGPKTAEKVLFYSPSARGNHVTHMHILPSPKPKAQSPKPKAQSFQHNCYNNDKKNHMRYNIVTIMAIWCIMLSLYTAYDVQLELKEFMKQSRKQQKLSVEALAKRSGVPYSTIRKFESTGNISLRQFLMLFETIGELKQFRELIKTTPSEPTSIDEVLKNA
jgi:ribosome-binding protein aMBF1 (putative translation factor)